MATTTAGEEFCDVCGTFDPIFDGEHGYYRCHKCNQVWARDEDDPDYDETDERLEEEGYLDSVVESNWLRGLAKIKPAKASEENFDGESMTDSLNFGNRDWNTGEILE